MYILIYKCILYIWCTLVHQMLHIYLKITFSDEQTASSYMWFTTVNKTGFFSKEYQLLVKGITTLFQQGKEVYLLFLCFQASLFSCSGYESQSSNSPG